MSMPQDHDLTPLDRLLRTYEERLQPLNVDTQSLELMKTLRSQCLDVLPRPGHGRTLERWQTLSRVAGCDLALAKLYEGHTDALAILAECGAGHLVGDGIWGVWAAEPPDARAVVASRDGDCVRLAGKKAWCSGALQIDQALITAWDESGQPQLVAIRLADPTLGLNIEHWQAVGMASTASVEVEFNDTPGVLVGTAGEYLSRPGFWHGGAGIAASPNRTPTPMRTWAPWMPPCAALGRHYVNVPPGSIAIHAPMPVSSCSACAPTSNTPWSTSCDM